MKGKDEKRKGEQWPVSAHSVFDEIQEKVAERDTARDSKLAWEVTIGPRRRWTNIQENKLMKPKERWTGREAEKADWKGGELSFAISSSC